MSDLMIENELRQTEILATAFAKTEAVYQKQKNNLMLRIILDDNDDSSTDSSDTSTTVDSTVDDDDNFRETLDHDNSDENNAVTCNRKRTMSDDSSGSPLKRLRPCFDHNRGSTQIQDDYLDENPV